MQVTQRYADLTDAQRREIRMYGVTEAQMREAVEESLTFRFSGPALYAASILSDAQEMIAHDDGGTFSFMQVEDARQAINRAKWVLFTYIMKGDAK
jgi:hypothetical protein